MTVNRRWFDKDGIKCLEVALERGANLDDKASDREMWAWWSRVAERLLDLHSDLAWWITAYGDTFLPEFTQLVATIYNVNAPRYVPEFRAGRDQGGMIGFAIQGSKSTLQEISFAALEYGYWFALCAGPRGCAEVVSNNFLDEMISSPLSMFPKHLSTILYTHDYARVARCSTADLNLDWM